MSDLKKYHGVIPAFYACYDEEGNISPERVRGLTRHLIGKGVNGLWAVPPASASIRAWRSARWCWRT